MLSTKKIPRSATPALLPVPHPRDLGMPHFLLQLEDAIHKRLTRWWAAWDIDIHGNDSVATPRHGVTVVIVSPTIRARSHGNYPSRVGHLIVHLSQRGSHLVRQCAGDNHNIRLSRGSTEDYTESILIVSRGREMHHFDGAAGEAECHGPKGALAGPVGDLVNGCPARPLSAFRIML